MRVYEENNRLVIADGTLTLWLEPWGENSFRVRMTKEAQMDAHDWALTEEVKMCPLQVECKEVDTTDPWYKGEEFAKYHQTGKVYTVKNGKITAVISPEGSEGRTSDRRVLEKQKPDQPLLCAAAH